MTAENKQFKGYGGAYGRGYWSHYLTILKTMPTNSTISIPIPDGVNPHQSATSIHVCARRFKGMFVETHFMGHSIIVTNRGRFKDIEPWETKFVSEIHSRRL